MTESAKHWHCHPLLRAGQVFPVGMTLAVKDIVKIPGNFSVSFFCSPGGSSTNSKESWNELF
jgi:hypothetical protein